MFLPTRHNNYRPWISEVPGLIVVTVLLICIHIFSNVIMIEKFNSETSHNNRIDESLLYEVNEYRSSKGIESLKIDDRLTEAAQAKLKHMFDNQYWAHISPDNTAAWNFIQNEKYFYKQSAENLARGFATPKGAVSGWYASDSHREAMLDPDYKNVGFASGRGTMKGEKTILYVALFADPLNGATIVNGEDSKKSLLVQGDAAKFIDNSQTVNFSLTNPVSLRSTLGWAGKVSLIILLFLAAIYIVQHIVILRKRIPKHLRSHSKPLIKLSIIALAILLIIATSFGSIS